MGLQCQSLQHGAAGDRTAQPRTETGRRRKCKLDCSLPPSCSYLIASHCTALHCTALWWLFFAREYSSEVSRHSSRAGALHCFLLLTFVLVVDSVFQSPLLMMRSESTVSYSEVSHFLLAPHLTSVPVYLFSKVYVHVDSKTMGVGGYDR
jgi:hypothetical protein